MKRLTRKEEEVMKILWDINEGFVKDIIDHYPDPKPHYNTISSIVRLLDEKGIVGHKAFGNTYLYFPILRKEDYRKTFIKDLISEYFDNSYKQTVSMFIDEQHLSDEELDDLINLIKSKKGSK